MSATISNHMNNRVQSMKDSQVVSSFFNDTGSYLKALEDAEALDLLPVVILLALFAVLGNVGNGITLYVYYTRFTPSSTRTYIIAMSVFDLLFTSITIPGEILDLRFSLTYSASWLCRLHRFLSIFLTVVSALILVAVALDRRRKICFPFRLQLTARQVSLSVVGCIVGAVVVGFPFGVLNGHHSVVTKIEGVTGSACSVDDEFIDTSFPLIYNALLLLIFLVSVVIMSVSYVQIARKIVKHKRKSMAGGGATVRTLAILMAKQEASMRGEGADTQQSSSHFEDSSVMDKNHCRPQENNNFHTSRLESKVEDEVFTTDMTGPTKLTSPSTSIDTKKSQSKKNTFKSHSTRKREKEFEMAVNTLVHAVSEDMLHSSELFKTRALSYSTCKTRSASVGDECSSCDAKKRPDSASESPKSRGKESPVEKNDITAQFGSMNSPTTPHNFEESNTDVINTPPSPEKDVNGTVLTQQENMEQTEVKSKADVMNTVTSSENEANGTTHSGTQGRDKIQSKGLKKSSLKSSKQNDVTGNDDRHVTISETGAERLQSILRHTLRRFKSGGADSLGGGDGDDAGGDGVTMTSTLRRRRHWGKAIPSRTTWMMFVLTAIFIVSYLPYLTITCVRAIQHDVETGLSGWKFNLYILGLRSYFINSIVNPVVYSFCSARFRHQCRHIFRRRPKMSISD